MQNRLHRKGTLSGALTQLTFLPMSIAFIQCTCFLSFSRHYTALDIIHFKRRLQEEIQTKPTSLDKSLPVLVRTMFIRP